MFAKQFFGTVSWVTLAVLALVHVLAIPLQHAQMASFVALGVTFVITAVVTWRSLSTGLLVAFAEIMVGGHGHLLAADFGGFSLSLRMVIFGAVMVGWFAQVVRRKVTPHFLPYRDVPFLLLAAAVLLGTVNGVLRNDPLHAFDDMNGFFTIAYLLPLASVVWDQERKRQLLQVLCASAAWVAMGTLLIVYVFTHLPGHVLADVYAFVRDARLAEVTLLTGPEWFVRLLATDAPWYFRVFAPAQFFTIVTALVLIAARCTLWRDERMPRGAQALLALCVAAFVASLSRSFFVGAFAGLAVTAVALLADAPRHRARLLKPLAYTSVLAAVGALLFYAVIVVPLPPQPDLRDAAFYRATEEDTRGLAVSSRWNLLYPMFTAIMEHPVLGSGFGTEVTYISDDPRVRQSNPSGTWTTYRFEWGYQDVWLKMGLLGLIAFISYGIVITHAFLYAFRTKDHRWLATGLFAGVAALFATQVFSPYLNHPIGLGFLLFVLPFFDWKGTLAAIEARERVRTEKKTAVSTPAVPVLERDV